MHPTNLHAASRQNTGTDHQRAAASISTAHTKEVIWYSFIKGSTTYIGQATRRHCYMKSQQPKSAPIDPIARLTRWSTSTILLQSIGKLVRVLVNLFSQSQKVTGPTFQTKSISSGVLSVVSLCELGSYRHIPFRCVIKLNSHVWHFQLGIFDLSRLRVECHSRTSPIPVDNMGL